MGEGEIKMQLLPETQETHGHWADVYQTCDYGFTVPKNTCSHPSFTALDLHTSVVQLPKHYYPQGNIQNTEQLA